MKWEHFLQGILALVRIRKIKCTIVNERSVWGVSHDDLHQQPEEGLEVVPLSSNRCRFEGYRKKLKSSLSIVRKRTKVGLKDFTVRDPRTTAFPYSSKFLPSVVVSSCFSDRTAIGWRGKTRRINDWEKRSSRSWDISRSMRSPLPSFKSIKTLLSEMSRCRILFSARV
jgi:hypothetical protein